MQGVHVRFCEIIGKDKMLKPCYSNPRKVLKTLCFRASGIMTNLWGFESKRFVILRWSIFHPPIFLDDIIITQIHGEIRM